MGSQYGVASLGWARSARQGQGETDRQVSQLTREAKSVLPAHSKRPSHRAPLRRAVRRWWLRAWSGSSTLLLVVLLPVTAATAAPKNLVDEFDNPGWTHLPKPSAFNKPPSCPVTLEKPQCTVAPRSQPPRDPGNPEKYLNSAYWPAEERPDIEMYAVQRYGYSYKNCSSHLPHYCFLLDAEAVGYPVGHKPRVGDLWLAPCDDLKWVDGAIALGCSATPGWFLGYVQKVYPDGSFVQSWGGSDTPADTGLGVTWFSGSMDQHAVFIHLMHPGARRPR
jgi:hypothetical protein